MQGFKLNLGGLNPGLDVNNNNNNTNNNNSGVPQLAVPPLGPQRSTGGGAPQQSQQHTYSRSSPSQNASPNQQQQQGFYNQAQSSDRGSLVPLSSERLVNATASVPMQIPHVPLSARGAAAGAAPHHHRSNSASGMATTLGIDAAEFLGVAAHEIHDIEYLRKQLDTAQKLFVTLEKKYEAALRDKNNHFMGLMDELRSSEAGNNSERWSQGSRPRLDLCDAATQTYPGTATAPGVMSSSTVTQPITYAQSNATLYGSTARHGSGAPAARMAHQARPTTGASSGYGRPSSGSASARGSYAMRSTASASAANKFPSGVPVPVRAPVSSRGSRTEPLLPAAAAAAMRSPRTGAPTTTSPQPNTTGAGGQFRPFRPAPVPTIALQTMLHSTQQP